MKNIFLVSSSGGHFSELKKLDINDYNPIYIVETKNNKDQLINHTLKYGTRSKVISYLFISIYNTLKALLLFVRYRPKILISTGAHTCVVFFIISKLFFCKSVYIESYAKVNSSSMTYRIIKKYAKPNFVIVQHRELQKEYEDSNYFGGIY